MDPDPLDKLSKKQSAVRKKIVETLEFEPSITVQFDELYRFFNYSYPGKNKQEIMNKCMTANTYWITLDSLYYPQNVDMETDKIAHFRKKTSLKNGCFPPTKDTLEQQKFILLLRRLVANRLNQSRIEDIRNTPCEVVLDFLGDMLQTHENSISHQFERLASELEVENQQNQMKLTALNIPLIKASKLFAYEPLEKEVIQSSVEKAACKDKEPRCDFCFTREKDIVKCKKCDLHAHPGCFPRIPKDLTAHNFICDSCLHEFPTDIRCQLCPSIKGMFLQLKDEMPIEHYRLQKGETNFKFRICRSRLQPREKTYIHISCFVFHPECSYNMQTGKVQGFHLIDRSKKLNNLCSICGNAVGMTLPCYNQNCRRSFHPECAKRNNLNINVIRANNKALLEIYCERHKKPDSYQFLRDSVTNRVKQFRKFFQNIDYEMKRYGVNTNIIKPKKTAKFDELLKQDRCLYCSAQNESTTPITNCKICYGWHHDSCCTYCPYCDL